MSKINTYFRALADYRKSTRENNDCARARKFIARANASDDRIEVVRTECDIDDDWIVAIEEGLEFIDKAIREERQFILSNGEVVPIEKVKNFSKESVEHLAKHSNLLTRVPEAGKDLVPDKLYTVERLTDYAVYENRFLYMLLCYLRDFIALRYNAIAELSSTYSGKLNVKKVISIDGRKTTCEIALDEQIKGDEYLKEHNSSKAKIDRISDLLRNVLSFLSTPLMEAVAKAPMLKPPITETNVLKTNKNFKGAMKLYFFVTAYDKLGYTVNRTTEVLNPFSEAVADEIAEVVEMCSFLTYEHGMAIEGDLKADYELELKREREAEQMRKLEQLQILRRRIKECGDNPEEYMLLLEQRNRYLEADSAELVRAKAEIVALKLKIEELDRQIAGLYEAIADLKGQLYEKQREIALLIEEHKAELERQAAEYEQKILDVITEYEEKMEAFRAECEARVDEAKEEFERRLSATVEEYDGRIADITARNTKQLEDLTASYEAKITSLREDVSKRQQNVAALETELKKMTEKKYVAEARVNALKKQTGQYSANDDFSTREGFSEIEKQFKYFYDFFNEQWGVTKKKIRKTYLKVKQEEATLSVATPMNNVAPAQPQGMPQQVISPKVVQPGQPQPPQQAVPPQGYYDASKPLYMQQNNEATVTQSQVNEQDGNKHGN